MLPPSSSESRGGFGLRLPPPPGFMHRSTIQTLTGCYGFSMTQLADLTPMQPGAATVISISEKGAERAIAAIAGSGKENAGVRLFIKSGGCSGYQYGMAIDDRQLEGDTVVYDRGVKLVVDPMSLPLVKGGEIDFIENMMGGGFTVNNPNATSGCGCGHSFRTDGAAGQEGEGSGGCGSH